MMKRIGADDIIHRFIFDGQSLRAGNMEMDVFQIRGVFSGSLDHPLGNINSGEMTLSFK